VSPAPYLRLCASRRSATSSKNSRTAT
jgi:hypothetical protein